MRTTAVLALLLPLSAGAALAAETSPPGTARVTTTPRPAPHAPPRAEPARPEPARADARPARPSHLVPLIDFEVALVELPLDADVSATGLSALLHHPVEPMPVERRGADAKAAPAARGKADPAQASAASVPGDDASHDGFPTTASFSSTHPDFSQALFSATLPTGLGPIVSSLTTVRGSSPAAVFNLRAGIGLTSQLALGQDLPYAATAGTTPVVSPSGSVEPFPVGEVTVFRQGLDLRVTPADQDGLVRLSYEGSSLDALSRFQSGGGPGISLPETSRQEVSISPRIRPGTSFVLGPLFDSDRRLVLVVSRS